MNEVYAIFTTGFDHYDRPRLFAVYASAEHAEADAALLRERLQDESIATVPGERLYSLVTVNYLPVR